MINSHLGTERPLVLALRRSRIAWTFALAVLVLLAGRSAVGVQPYIELGPKDYFAISQPYVQVELWDGATSLGPDPTVGANEFLLDTGANSILAVDAGAQSLGAGYATEGTFFETGVADTVLLYVSAPYRFDFAGTDGVPVTLPATADSVRILSNPYENFGLPELLAPPGLVGMSAMVNRVTTLNMVPLFDTGMEVAFHDSLPTGNGYRLSVSVDDRVSFDVRAGLDPDAPPDAPLPAWAPVPFLTAKPEYQGVKRSGNFLLDTGAAMSAVSEDFAKALGLDEDGDGKFDGEALGYEMVGGLGGTVLAPVLYVDRLHLPTDQGVDLVWTDLQILVVDIPDGIDGIFGADLLASNDFAFDWETWEFTGDPFFQDVHLDFRDMLTGDGTVYFDLTPRFYQIVTPPIPGDANDDGKVDDEDASILASHWHATIAGGAAVGDFNGDGVVDDRDASILAVNWGTGVLPPLPGDANGDGVVNDVDASILALHWHSTIAGGAKVGDFNGDGVVDDRDASILAVNWTRSTAEGSAAVPEPSTMTLVAAALLLGALGVVVRFVRR